MLNQNIFPIHVKDAMRSEMKTKDFKFHDGAAQRRSTTGKRSYCSVQSNKSQTTALKSRYCPEMLGKANLDNGRSNMVRPRSAFGKNIQYCDYIVDEDFIRQLLAINKKEAVLLNKKLAQILRDKPEESTGRKGTRLNIEESCSTSPMSSDDDYKKPQLVRDNRLSTRGEVKKRSRVQYDLNGRRVYLGEDEDHESVVVDVNSDVDEAQVEISTNSQSWFNTTTLIQAKSDMTCNLNNVGPAAAQRKSLTLFNHQSMCKTKPRERCLSLCGEWGGRQRSCYTRECEPNGKATLFCKGTIHGDGVQSAVAHCCEVDLTKPESKKTLQRVWNYHDIPKVQSEGTQDSGGHKTDPSTRSTNRGPGIKLKSTIPPILNR